jgi:hypothetical protein
VDKLLLLEAGELDVQGRRVDVRGLFSSSFGIPFALNHLFLGLESYARGPQALRLDMQFTVVRQDINRFFITFSASCCMLTLASQILFLTKINHFAEEASPLATQGRLDSFSLSIILCPSNFIPPHNSQFFRHRTYI